MAWQPKPPGLIQRYREELQTRHCARRTVKTYELWLRRFLRFHGMRHPHDMGSKEVNAFLTRLAVELQVSASAQNQALAALLFLYRELLERSAATGGAQRGGGACRADKAGGRVGPGGGAAVWQRPAVDGSPAAAGEGSRFRAA